jgi:hypothetical protein
MSAHRSLSSPNLQSTEQTTFSQPKLMEITLCINSKSLPFAFIVLSPLLLQSPPTSTVHSKFAPPDLLQKSQSVRSRAKELTSRRKRNKANAKSLQPKSLQLKHEALQKGEEAQGLLQRKVKRPETSRAHHDGRDPRWSACVLQIRPHYQRNDNENRSNKRVVPGYKKKVQTVG